MMTSVSGRSDLMVRSSSIPSMPASGGRENDGGCSVRKRSSACRPFPAVSTQSRCRPDKYQAPCGCLLHRRPTAVCCPWRFPVRGASGARLAGIISVSVEAQGVINPEIQIPNSDISRTSERGPAAASRNQFFRRPCKPPAVSWNDGRQRRPAAPWGRSSGAARSAWSGLAAVRRFVERVVAARRGHPAPLDSDSRCACLFAGERIDSIEGVSGSSRCRSARSLRRVSPDRAVFPGRHAAGAGSRRPDVKHFQVVGEAFSLTR